MNRILFALSFLACFAVCGQSAEPDLSFEVASVRLSGPESRRGSNGGPGTKDPGRFTFNRADLRDLIFRAYGLEDYQAQITGPSWIDTEDYDVAVKIRPGASKEEFQAMLRNLLKERFQLKVHHELKTLPVYELVVSRNGPKLKSSDTAAQPADDPRARPVIGAEDKDGFPQLPPGSATWSMMNRPSRSRLAAQQQPVSVLPVILRNAMGRPIIDKTGLRGHYDFRLEFDPQAAAGGTAANGESPAPDIFIAIQQQLGLRLVEGKSPFDVVVVDDVRRIPTEN